MSIKKVFTFVPLTGTAEQNNSQNVPIFHSIVGQLSLTFSFLFPKEFFFSSNASSAELKHFVCCF